MSKWILALSVAVFGAAFVVTEADAAKRMGSGRSVGTQRNVTPPPSKAAPNQQQGAQQAAPAQGAPGQPAAAPTAGSKWGGILGGLALGGMLGYLLGGGGLGALGNILMLALLAIAVVFIVRALLARRAGAGMERQEPAALAGMHGERMTPPAHPAPAQSYGGQLAASKQVNLPAGFDAAGFLRGARMNFMKLQVANDRGDLREIQEFTTPEMFEALKGDIAARSGKQETDIMSVDADLLELVSEDGQHWASVRFSGMERERPGGEAVGFEEVWNLVKPIDGATGWLLAGIQQMH
jgi:predicted lipid-binding transport protein (Tim44 family)